MKYLSDNRHQRCLSNFNSFTFRDNQRSLSKFAQRKGNLPFGRRKGVNIPTPLDRKNVIYLESLSLACCLGLKSRLNGW